MDRTRGPVSPGFTVDTHILRELGELLVGRDSTAVLELVKNAYDADASRIVLDAVNLGGPEAVIRVVDDGNGMTRHRFETAFLRIACREKEEGDRRSPRYGRRYTGQKGIGRLAAHKLAAWLSVTSIPLPDASPQLAEGVRAVLDWDLIEQQYSLDHLDEGLEVSAIPPQPGVPSGTALELRRLRSSWTDKQRSLFVAAIRAAQPPAPLADGAWPGIQLAAPVLVPRPQMRDGGRRDDPGFEVVLGGELDTGEDLWQRAGDEFEWLVEIDAETDVVRFQVTPSRAYAASEPAARTYRFQRSTPVPGRPQFQARIFTMPRASTRRGPLAGFVSANSGVRVYLEGFRVLPYGELGDDWLGIDREYRAGPRFYTIDVDEEASDQVEADRKESLVNTPNTGYFGAVFLTDRGSGGLRSLVNREGFVPDAVFDSLVDLVQTGIRLSVRVRRAVYLQVKERRDREKDKEEAAGTRSERGDKSDAPPRTEGGGYADRALQPVVASSHTAAAIAEARAVVLGTGEGSQPSREDLNRLLTGFSSAERELSRLRILQPDLRVLASVGLQLGAFVHDINGMLGQVQTVRELLSPLQNDTTLSQSQARRVRQVGRALDDLAHALARQSSYLTDVLIADPRRRRSRTRLRDRLDVARRLLSDQIARAGIDLVDVLPSDLKTPPMFPAEVGVLLTNLLTNAVKNAGSPGVVKVEGEQLGQRGATLRMHNTGVAVDLNDAERWFRPFESTTTEVDEALGQGLGLGLPITRALVEDYRGSVRFVEPPPGFATSIEVQLPDIQERP